MFDRLDDKIMDNRPTLTVSRRTDLAEGSEQLSDVITVVPGGGRMVTGKHDRVAMCFDSVVISFLWRGIGLGHTSTTFHMGAVKYRA